MWHPLIEYVNTDVDAYNKKSKTNYQTKIETKSIIPIYEKFLKSVVYENKWQKIPIISVLFGLVFYFVVFVFTYSNYCL